MKLSNKMYDVIKWITLHALPALATLYFAVAKIWNFPYAAEVVGTISAIDAFLGALLGLSSKNYEGDGTLNVFTNGADEHVELFISNPVENITDQDMVTFRVKKTVVGEE